MLAATPSSTNSDTRSVTRRRFLIGGAATALTAAGHAATHGRHELEVVPLTVAVRDLPDSFQNFRFVQISDIHLREFTEPWFLEKVVDRINDLDPELVLFTGDLVSRGPAREQVAWNAAGIGAEILERLKAPQRFAILGNHDVGVGVDRVITPLTAHGTPVLQNEYVSIDRGADRIWICGTEDVTYGLPQLRKAIPENPQAPVILLAHEPDFADNVAWHPRSRFVSLMLSGHSHGGQVRLPFAGPLILPPLGRKYSMGSYKVGNIPLYVNRGIGTVGLPFRFNCSPELTHFTLVRS